MLDALPPSRSVETCQGGWQKAIRGFEQILRRWCSATGRVKRILPSGGAGKYEDCYVELPSDSGIRYHRFIIDHPENIRVASAFAF